MPRYQARADLAYRDDYLLGGEVLYLDGMQRVYLEREGAGEPLLMVPGLTGDAAELAPLRDVLAARFDTVALDRRGFSRSPRGWRKSSVEEQAGDLARVLDLLQWDSAHVFAASVGASVALAFWMRHPRRVRSLVLHEPWAPGLLPDPQAFADELARGEAAVQAARARRNTGPFEARLRHLMGPAFEALPAEARARLVKNGEMHAVENAFAAEWSPPSAALFPRERGACRITVGDASWGSVAAMARAAAGLLGVACTPVVGMHAPWLEDAGAYASAAGMTIGEEVHA
jgi:pimeloyl-ACP methyl ester carboxylesterase